MLLFAQTSPAQDQVYATVLTSTQQESCSGHPLQEFEPALEIGQGLPNEWQTAGGVVQQTGPVLASLSISEAERLIALEVGWLTEAQQGPGYVAVMLEYVLIYLLSLWWECCHLQPNFPGLFATQMGWELWNRQH